MRMSKYHTSVLLKEAVTALDVAPGKKYIDATLGAGGHTKAIIEKGGIVLGIDQDSDAIAEVEKNFQFEILNFKLKIVQGNFSNIAQIARDNGFEKVAGILFDVGVSSHQLDTNERGFSFLSDSSLDMRMDKSLAVTAADLLKVLTKKQLYELFCEYGEETNAWKIAEEIEKVREKEPITTTSQLASLVARVSPKKGLPAGRQGKIHPATKVFQALRIAVNDELGSLEKGLHQAVELLETKGKLVVISFHSLEDRITKNSFKEFADNKLGEIQTGKPIVPGSEEIERNSRARSAKMRVFIKI